MNSNLKDSTQGRVLHHDPGLHSPCGYLPGLQATTEYFLLSGVGPVEYEEMLRRGWRRFGPAYFRPACPSCMECVGLRVPVATFQPSRSQRRVHRTFSKVEVRIGEPRMDQERLELLHKWYLDRELRRGWKPQVPSAQNYALDFCYPHPCALEMTYYLEERLIAVGLVDETVNALSSVFFYYDPDPDIRKLSPGTAGVLCELDYARSRNLQYLYLGYRVQGCVSSVYKGSFRPHELLTSRPQPDQEPYWEWVES